MIQTFNDLDTKMQDYEKNIQDLTVDLGALSLTTNVMCGVISEHKEKQEELVEQTKQLKEDMEKKIDDVDEEIQLRWQHNFDLILKNEDKIKELETSIKLKDSDLSDIKADVEGLKKEQDQEREQLDKNSRLLKTHQKAIIDTLKSVTKNIARTRTNKNAINDAQEEINVLDSWMQKTLARLTDFEETTKRFQIEQYPKIKHHVDGLKARMALTQEVLNQINAIVAVNDEKIKELEKYIGEIEIGKETKEKSIESLKEELIADIFSMEAMIKERDWTGVVKLIRKMQGDIEDKGKDWKYHDQMLMDLGQADTMVSTAEDKEKLFKEIKLISWFGKPLGTVRRAKNPLADAFYYIYNLKEEDFTSK